MASSTSSAIDTIRGVYSSVIDANTSAEKILRWVYGSVYTNPKMRLIYDNSGCLEVVEYPSKSHESDNTSFRISVEKHRVVPSLGTNTNVPRLNKRSASNTPLEQTEHFIPPGLKRQATRVSEDLDWKQVGAASRSVNSTPFKHPIALWHLTVHEKTYAEGRDSSEYWNSVTTEADELKNAYFLSRSNAIQAFKQAFDEYEDEDGWPDWEEFSENHSDSHAIECTNMIDSDANPAHSMSLVREMVWVYFRKDSLGNGGLVETDTTKLKVMDWDGTEEQYDKMFPQAPLRGSLGI
ncbi:hypothetical protein BJ508DRAFT_335101 [Ascobolus immersus RN42]|uniref:Uncharacterized protein n=1 Tax=Ascobolus immersus RN42 TaxID=1160509 RepID=A0A3N4HDR8_ASCIM|nr:hypothetical protein BJ508DRAFT_335101 [Ascobolus immersus RN42]